MLAVINNPKNSIGLFVSNKVTVNDKPLYIVCDNSTGNAWTEETESKFKAYAFLDSYTDGEKFHCVCGDCGLPINDVFIDSEYYRCEECHNIEYPDAIVWETLNNENPDACYYTEFTEDEDMCFIVEEQEGYENPIDKYELIEYEPHYNTTTTTIFIDIDRSKVPADVLNWLYEEEVYDYMDAIITEHLFSDIVERYRNKNNSDDEIPEYIINWNAEMNVLMTIHNASYWRIIGQ